MENYKEENTNRENYNEKGATIHIADLKKLQDLKLSFDSSLVRNSNDESGTGEKIEEASHLLGELERVLTDNLGFETVIQNAERRFRRKGTSIYFTRAEDFGEVKDFSKEKEKEQLKSRGVKTICVDTVAQTIFRDAKDIAEEMNIELATSIESVHKKDFPVAIYDKLDKDGNILIYEKIQDLPERSDY